MPKSPVKTNPYVAAPRIPQKPSAVSAQSVKRPVAPPVYSPGVKSVAQAKIARPSPLKAAPVAPAVYRPQPTPKVLQTKAASPAVIQCKGPVASNSNQQKQGAPYRRAPNVGGVIQRSKGWGKLPQVKPEGNSAFPALGSKLSPQEEEEIRQIALVKLAAQKEEAQKKLEALQQKLVEIENRDTRETWWGLLGLNEGSAGNKIVTWGKIDGKTVHITVVKARTTHPSFKADSVAEIVNKIIGPNNVPDSVHATLELHGMFAPHNPHYYRNGDRPNCTDEQAEALREKLLEFIVDANELVAREKQRLLGP